MKLSDDTLTILMALNHNAHDLGNLAMKEMSQRGISHSFKGDVLDTPFLSESLQNYYDAFRANIANLPQDVLTFFQLNDSLKIEVSDFVLGVAKKGNGRTDIRQVPLLMRSFEFCFSTLLKEDDDARLHRHFYLAAYDFTEQAFTLALREQINESNVFGALGHDSAPTRTKLEEFDEFNASHKTLNTLFEKFNDEQKAKLNALHTSNDDNYASTPAPADTVEELMAMTKGNDIRNTAICGGWITRAVAKKWRGMITPHILKS